MSRSAMRSRSDSCPAMIARHWSFENVLR